MRCIVLIILFFSLFSANASEYIISPIRIYISQKESIVTLRITNQTAKQAVLQLSLKNWQQNKNKIVLKETSDLIATPPLFRLGPNKTQLIRLAFIKPFDKNYEQAYRLLITEVPEKETGLEQVSQLKILLQFSLPIFIEPSAGVSEKITWHIIKQGKKVKLRANNQGNNVVLIAQAELLNQQKTLWSSHELVYVFPGDFYEWLVPDTPGKTIQAKVNNHSLIDYVT